MIGPKQFLLGGIAFFALTAVAAAADIPMRAPQPVYAKAPQVWSWEGQYIGVHGGYARASDDLNLGGSPGQLSPSGAIGGVQIGYNRHFAPNWVLGYEVDFSFADLRSTSALGANITTLDIDRLGTARTRLGYAQGPWMFYATAGLAWAKPLITIAGGARIDRPQVGYAIGAGLEYALNRNWSAKFEYIYADLGETNTFIAGAVVNTDLTMSVVRVGLNYRFANWDAPVATAYAVKTPVRTSGWTGAYLGVHGGYGWGAFEALGGGVSQSLRPDGAIGGIQSGYNWQLSRNWVVGLEADSSWGSIKETIGAANIDVDASGTVRARLGYASNNLLFYGTGGLAWAHADSVTNLAIRDQFYLGWTAGAGVEWAIARQWSAKAEYLYADYGRISDFNGGVLSNTLDVHSVRFGLNYRASLLGLLTGR